jgi:hypothetical protein
MIRSLRDVYNEIRTSSPRKWYILYLAILIKPRLIDQCAQVMHLPVDQQTRALLLHVSYAK